MPDNGFIDNGCKCGNCKGYHESAAAVKLCYQEAKAAQAQASVPATQKQEDFLRKLLQERDHGWANPESVLKSGLANRAAASGMIEMLLGMPKAAPHFNTAAELEDGVYRKDDTFYKVYHTVHGANMQVAKVLHLTDAGKDADGKQLWNGEWEYLGKKPLYSLKPEHKLTQAEAKQFGLVYGMCVNCTRDLTREESIYVGYGPTCAKNHGWWYPTKVELKALLVVDQQVQAAEADSHAEACSEPF